MTVWGAVLLFHICVKNSVRWEGVGIVWLMATVLDLSLFTWQLFYTVRSKS